MFIPIGDSPNPKDYTPWGNWLLIAVNVAVYLFISRPLMDRAVSLYDPSLQEYLQFVAPRIYHNLSLSYLLQQISSYDLFVFAHGYKAGAPQLSDLISSLFLHGSFIHLAGNMFFLWIYGGNVEHRLGHLLYLLLYLFCGVAATLFFAAFTGNAMTPLIGASGAISGILGLYFLFFPHNQIKVFIAFFPFFFNVVRLPARLVLGFYLLVDNLLPFLGMRGGGVAYGAHIGGFLAGLFCAWNLLKLPRQTGDDDIQ
ncbi:MAG: rhomboid family intramembrane serine protease [Deltaproteobacteria bacterium]|nr:rhomboid family intramembrane serine protease [Deltaproteobacteria bacterium]